MTPRYEGTFAFDTDRGKVRLTNEDQSRVVVNCNRDVMLLVCDGMGGQNKGDYASKYAADTLSEAFMQRTSRHFTKYWLASVIKRINRDIYSDAEQNPLYEGMGTTLVCLILEGDHLIVANIGDSRAYTYGPLGLTCLTTDQTYVDYLMRTGKINENEAKTRSDRHMLMNALGIFPSVSVDIYSKRYSGEALLCCSDGLYNSVSEAEIRAILACDDHVDMKVSQLINEGNHNGGSDNIAVAYWEVSR